MLSLIKKLTIKSYICLIILFILQAIAIMPSCAKKLYTPKEALDIKTEAFALYNTNRPDEALKLLNQIPSDSRNEEVYTLIANIHQDKGDVDAAVENLNKAIKINPRYYKIYYNLGCIFLDKNSLKLAKDNFKLSIKYNKKFAFAYYNLGCCYLREKDYTKAKKNFIKAISAKGDEKDFYMNLALCYKMLGNDKQVQKILDIYNGAPKKDKKGTT